MLKYMSDLKKILVVACLFMWSSIGFITDLQANVENNNVHNEELQKKSKRKRICVLYGNCQVEAIGGYLKQNYPKLYDYFIFVNFQILREEREIPIELLNKADLFIYQPLHGHGSFDTEFIISNYLKKTCRCISLPYIYFSGYFPDYIHDPNNSKTVSIEFPHGMFYAGHQKIKDFVEARVPPGIILEKCMQLDLYNEALVLENCEKTLKILEDREKDTNIKVAYFIRKNFRKVRLFHMATHPTNIMLKLVTKKLLSIMKLDPNAVENNSYFNEEVLKAGCVDIIYPSVANILGLEFDFDKCYCRKQETSTIQYIEYYIRYLYPEYIELNGW